MAENKGKTVKIPAISPRARPEEEASNYRAMHNVDRDGRPLNPDQLMEREVQLGRPQETPHPKDKSLPKTTYAAVVAGEITDAQRRANLRAERSKVRSKKK